MAVNTRARITDPVCGVPRDFSGNVLPTHEDLLKCYLWVRQELKQGSRKEPTVSQISTVLCTKLTVIWEKASIPVLSNARIMTLIRTYHEKYMRLLKQPKAKQSSEIYQKRLEQFKQESREKLFDIAACKCVFVSCKCERIKKVPASEQAFLLDQRTCRKMAIGNLDIIATQKLRRAEKRKLQEEIRKSKCTEGNAKRCTAAADGTQKNEDATISDESDGEEFVDFRKSELTPSNCFAAEPSPSSGNNSQNDNIPTEKPTAQQMRLRLPTLAKTCDRYGVSNRAAAAIASAVLKDVGLITQDNSSKVIDKCKLQRERQKSRKLAIAEQLDSRLIRGLYFDGRKDKTLVQYSVGGKYHRREVTEEHLVLVEEPQSKYLGHTTPSSGSAEHIKESIFEFFNSKSIGLDHLLAFGCDGTNVNTGIRGGVLRLIELELKRPIQWLVCQLHGNELPLRHLFHYLDGKTKGPSTFSGPIGKLLEACEKLPVIAYSPISVNSEMPDVNNVDLSTDQKYLRDICQAVSSGECSLSLAYREPGKLSHARWLTTANRVLRLYVSTENPSTALTNLVDFVLNVYAPMWFKIKSHPSCKDGARHLWQTIKLSRYLSDDLKKVIDPVISRNAYFAHPENLILAMLTDERQHVRELGLRRILKAREIKTKAIRHFKLPSLNFDAEDYINLIDWQNTEVTEPPITSNISTEDLKEFIRSPDTPMLDFPKFPCHTQAVERCVKLVTEAAKSVVGPAARDGFIHSRIIGRQEMPHFDSKRDFHI